MYSVVIKAPAKKQIDHLDKLVKGRIHRALLRLAETPSIGKRLKGILSAYWSYRVGDWRIIYQIEAEQITIVIVAVGHRRDIYETISKVAKHFS